MSSFCPKGKNKRSNIIIIQILVVPLVFEFRYSDLFRI